jgi:hypothetical protein
MDRQTKYPPYDEGKPYAIYTRYPEGIGEGRWAEDLRCPACGGDEIVVIKEFEFGASGMLGDFVQCWTCKCEFQITDNCWHAREIKH